VVDAVLEHRDGGVARAQRVEPAGGTLRLVGLDREHDPLGRGVDLAGVGEHRALEHRLVSPG